MVGSHATVLRNHLDNVGHIFLQICNCVVPGQEVAIQSQHDMALAFKEWVVSAFELAVLRQWMLLQVRLA